MDNLKFTETVFTDSSKQGKLIPDDSGYYKVILGALNIENTCGEYYCADKVVDIFTKSSSSFMRKITTGCLYAEVGHPKKTPGMSFEDFYNRIMTIEETNICAHIADVELDFSFGKNHPEYNNPDIIAIVGKVKPAGAKSYVLESAIANHKQNICFSIRGVTDNFRRGGKIIRRLINVVTFDWVAEPGIPIAYKHLAPGLERRIERAMNYDKNVLIDKPTLLKVLETNSKIALESDSYFLQELRRTVSSAAHKLASW